ncbi:hypothetical protein HPB49_020438 [Dermacentor silvarum]|uniref:Uncharacterized protein n=1 Tax=Dermacentor silvarum TaxID=543639 RepID=A0ACB8DFL5_DERSI|nr:hypothetical protein HPB49_020438 [Dermacentor silvarum]
MPDSDKAFILHKINEHWTTGTLHDEWTSSIITLIPKPGKPATLSNQRRISLTSCVGKTMERMVLACLTDLLDDTHFLPHNQIGFRPRMPTQDLFVLLQETFFQPSRCNVHALVTIPYFMPLSSPPSKTPAVDPDSTLAFLLFTALDKRSSDSGPRYPHPSHSPAENLKWSCSLQPSLTSG